MRTKTHPPGISNAALESAFGGYDAVLRGGQNCFSALLPVGPVRPTWVGTSSTGCRPPRPYAAPVARPRTRSWPNGRSPACEILRRRSEESVPTLFLPPQAGHDSCIVDFDPQQSQVPLALTPDSPTSCHSTGGSHREHKDATVEDYMAVMVEAIARLGGRVNLVGDCQGGWLAVIYAGLHPTPSSS